MNKHIVAKAQKRKRRNKAREAQRLEEMLDSKQRLRKKLRKYKDQDRGLRRLWKKLSGRGK